MIFEQISTGGDRNFGYFIADRPGGRSAVVDPSGRPELFLELNAKHDCELKFVICTHGHSDHTGGSREICRQSPALVALHKSAGDAADMRLEDDEELILGDLTLKILHTPGHTADSICIYLEDILVCGDTLFIGKVGGTYTDSDSRAQYDSLHKKLMTLPGKTKVYPGHDYGVTPHSTIADEKKMNPFIICQSFEDFIDLKANWAQYKKKHGIK